MSLPFSPRLRPRDARRYELGAVMGAQVKTGSSYFKSPQKDAEGTITGWWFAEDDREHFDYWLRHALPHVVILRDQDRNLSFWVHVTPERVVSTGKGAKILVPDSQTVDADHNDALSDVALTQLPTPTWDGTAWTGAVHLAPVDEVRHALITPRLITPHPNLAPSSISGLEALAMQVLFRDDLERFWNRSAFLHSQGRITPSARGCHSTMHVRPTTGVGAPLLPFISGTTKENPLTCFSLST